MVILEGYEVWKSVILACMVMSIFLGGVMGETVYAEPIEVNAVGEYDVGGNDTREHAKSAAYDNAKRNALEQVAVNVESRTDVSMGPVTRDDIMSYAKGRLRIIGSPRYEFSNNGSLCRAYIKAIVDVDLEELKHGATASKRDRTEIVDAGSKDHDVASNSVLKGAIEWRNHYYKIFNMPLAWEMANLYCKRMGGHLATAETEEENDKIKQIFLDNGQLDWCWIGGKRNDNKIWKWVTGKTMAEYFDWAGGKPREGLQLGGPYLALWKRHYGQWDNLKKREKLAFMCEWESPYDAHEIDS